MIIGATGLCAILDRLLSRGRPEVSVTSADGLWVDLAFALTLWLLCFFWLHGLASGLNPRWRFDGQDYHEYLGQALHQVDPRLGLASPYRYRLYTWLAAVVSDAAGLPISRAAMLASILGYALTVPACYLLGRLAAPRPVAAAGALMSLHLPPLLQGLGVPWDYSLSTALFVLVAATGIRAVRDGGLSRYLMLGVALGLYLSSTPKALPASLQVLGAAAMASVVSGRGRRRTAHELSAMMAPITVAWLICSQFEEEVYSLEHAILVVQTYSGFLDPAKPFPALGWTPDDPAELRGYWVFGRFSSLWRLPWTLLYLVDPPLLERSLATKLELLTPLVEYWSLRGKVWLLYLALFATAGAAIRRPRVASNWIAAGLAPALLVVQGWGLTTTVFADRFAFPVLAIVPTMLVMGATTLFRVGIRSLARREWVYLPVVFVAGSQILERGALGLDVVGILIDAPGQNKHPLDEVIALQAELEEGDLILDTTGFDLASIAFHRDTRVRIERALIVGSFDPQQFRSEPSTASRRWIMLPCAGADPGEHAGRFLIPHAVFYDDPTRFERLRDCIYLDHRPDLPVEATTQALWTRRPWLRPPLDPRDPSWYSVEGPGPFR